MTNNETNEQQGNDGTAVISQKSAFTSPLLIIALAITGAIAIWGLIDAGGLAAKAALLVHIQFTSRAWFIMLAVSFMLIVSIWLALSRYGRIRLGADDDEPEFSTISWLTMLFAAGMGVGLLFWGSAEPLTHFDLISKYESPGESANLALFITNFHWGIHAWAIYALTGLVIAYFGFRRGCPSLIGAPILDTFGRNRVTNVVSWLSNLLAIVAIAIGVGGSIAMGVFQVKDGIDTLFSLSDTGLGFTTVVFFVLCVAYFPPLVVDLSTGMAKLSNAAMAVAGALMIFVLLAGPTHFLMGGITQAVGEYFTGALVHGFRTFTFLRVGAFCRRVYRTHIERANHSRVYLRRDSRADPVFDLVVRSIWRRRILRSVAQRLRDHGRGQKQRQRCHLFHAGELPAATADHLAGHRGRIFVHRHQRRQRSFRTGDVFDRG
jgi:choline-glycine betaine transporter